MTAAAQLAPPEATDEELRHYANCKVPPPFCRTCDRVEGVLVRGHLVRLEKSQPRERRS